ncbi:MAG: transketolase, partial [Bdellovibrionota bacterium]
EQKGQDLSALIDTQKDNLTATFANASEALRETITTRTATAISFIAQVGTIPHVEVYSLSTSSEAEALVTEAVESFVKDRAAGKVPPTRIFFLGRENFPRQLGGEGARYELGKDQVLLDTTSEFSNAVTIVAAGSLVTEALKAADLLR